MTFWDFAHLHFFELFFLLLSITFIFAMIFWFLVFLINKYSLNLTSKWLNLKSEKIPLSEYVSRDTLVFGQLSTLREYSNAEIAAVFSLHNGGKFNNGISVQKWSLTHDCCADGSFPFYDKSLKYRDQLISQTDWVANAIIEDLYFLDISTMREISAWRREFVRNSIVSCVFKLVQTNDAQELIVGLFFRDTIIDKSTFDSKKLIEYSDRISSILKTGMDNL
ncbi:MULTISPECIES: hypothetical protein [Leptospira]|uniref:Uncharacterized protein n=2 Tax=Leptospira TaxID=171 RepID=A0A6H3NS81_9LEPT|nr:MULTISPECIES: hypothetical protein [Leptospira]TGL05029.1 hypothetical protein EHQ43_10350 [Leptospira bouyouniensis]TGN13446.1 hypothetical protein EHR08_11315 [Leptospira bandrabouensis]